MNFKRFVKTIQRIQTHLKSLGVLTHLKMVNLTDMIMCFTNVKFAHVIPVFEPFLYEIPILYPI